MSAPPPLPLDKTVNPYPSLPHDNIILLNIDCQGLRNAKEKNKYKLVVGDLDLWVDK